MRVRELASELGLSTDQVIDGLWTLGVVATGGEMVLAPEVVEVARRELPKVAPKPEPAPAPECEAPEAPAPPEPPPEPERPVRRVTEHLPSGHRRRRRVKG